MDEGRKRVIGSWPQFLRELAWCDPDRKVPTSITAISDSVKWAAQILRKLMSDGLLGSLVGLLCSLSRKLLELSHRQRPENVVCDLRWLRASAVFRVASLASISQSPTCSVGCRAKFPLDSGDDPIGAAQITRL